MRIRQQTGGRYLAENITLRNLIVNAYDIRDFQISGGSAWIGSDRWDISAKPETDVPPNAEGNRKLQAMIRNLLAERFRLSVHTETKEMPIYALIVGKSGPKLQPSSEGANAASMSMGKGQLKITKGSLQMLSQTIASIVGRTVIDETGITGDYDFKLEFAPEQVTILKPGDASEKQLAETDNPTIFTALQQQLDLRLESKKGPVKILVIDRAEKATEN